jgi:hypothetical protein
VSSSDAFALRQSGLNEFLFAPVGTEANGMTLSLVSVFARLGNDPWLEAGRLARLPRSEAIESLARVIAGMPTSIWPLPAATVLAARLVTLLPTQSGKSGPVPSSPALRAKIGLWGGLTVVLVCVACLLAFEAGVFRVSDVARPDVGSIASFGVSPR